MLMQNISQREPWNVLHKLNVPHVTITIVSQMFSACRLVSVLFSAHWTIPCIIIFGKHQMEDMVYYGHNTLSHSLGIIFHCSSSKVYKSNEFSKRPEGSPAVHISRERMKTKWVTQLLTWQYSFIIKLKWKY